MSDDRYAFLKINSLKGRVLPTSDHCLSALGLLTDLGGGRPFWVGLFFGLILFAGLGQPALAREIAGPNSKQSLLPIITPNYAYRQSIFGAQMNGVIDESQGLSQAVKGGVYWVRFDAFDWHRIEPVQTVPSTFRWENVAEDSLVRAAQNGFKVIAVVKYTPGWAQKYPGSACGPIKSTAFAEFAEFLTAVVNRYKAPPYNIKYWELGNEPDAPIWYNKSVFGCWGEVNDPYFGGEYYAQMLKAAYPAIKAADPQAQVLIGGLLLDNPDKNTKNTPRFLEGILRGGGGPFFDVVSFHSYSYFWGTVGHMSNLNWPGSITGIPEKTFFIKNVLSRHGLANKTLMLTETALHCDIESPECLKTQSVFATRAYIEGLALGLQSVVYYSMRNDYRGLGLIRQNFTLRPAYQAYKTASSFLTKARYLRPATGYPSGIAGHSFLSFLYTPLDIIWSADGTVKTVPLPPGSSALDFNGNPLSHVSGTIAVDYGPVYILKTKNRRNS